MQANPEKNILDVLKTHKLDFTKATFKKLLGAGWVEAHNIFRKLIDFEILEFKYIISQGDKNTYYYNLK